MEKVSTSNIYDLVVIGNGIAAQSFFWNLSQEESKSQNFSIAHIYSEKLAPACTYRSSATVSLNGIDEDVSALGNDMREAYFLFDEMFKKHHPRGVEEVSRTVVSTNENDTKKLTRRYKTLKKVTSSKINSEFDGTEYNSYIITPEVFMEWMSEQIKIKKDVYKLFLKNMIQKDDLHHLVLEDGNVIIAKKVLFAMGAYSKVFEKMLAEVGAESTEEKNTIKAGSYFERDINLGEKSFYLSIDGHQVLYRKNSYEQKLIIGSATTIGAFEAPELAGLAKIFNKVKPLLTFDLGEMSDYRVVTGLRHKGPKRLLICDSFNEAKTLYRINGLYKNGYTMAFLAARRMNDLIFKN